MKIAIRLVRCAAVISIGYAVLIWCDLLTPARMQDFVVVTHKEVGTDHGGRFNPTFGLLREHSVTATGRFTSYGDLRSEFYETVQLGDTLKVYFSSIFLHWKRADLIKSGSVVESSSTKDNFQSGVFSMLLLAPLFSFRPHESWWKEPVFWVSYGLSVILGLASWIVFIVHMVS